MDTFIPQIIYDLLRLKRGKRTHTRIFSKLKHNAELCPAFQNKLEQIVESYQRYHQITYDIQGLRDRGTDVIFRQDADNGHAFVCLQIKSDSDLDTADYLTKLKAQTFESHVTYEELLDYYIIVCCDLSSDKASFRKRKEQLRTVSAEFATAKNVHVIEPEFAVGFLNLRSFQIDAAIKRKFGSEDVVFSTAEDAVIDLSPTERALLFRMIVLHIYEDQSPISLSRVKASNHLREIYEIVPDRSREWFELMEAIKRGEYEDSYWRYEVKK